jgi:uncharacterized protein (TIGR02145 family)
VDGVKYFTTQNGNTVTEVAGTNIVGRYAYDNNEANVATDGALYTWDGAMAGSTTEGARGICPAGWHIPTDAEQNTLDQYLKDSGQTCDANRNNAWDCSTAGTKMKVGGNSGLNIPLAGYRNTAGGFDYRGAGAFLWSSSQVGGTAWNRALYSGYATVYRYPYSKAFGFSLRCLKDSTNTNPATTVTDIDGNTYGVVTVGTQTWLNANLRTTRYTQYAVTLANGAAIPDATLHGYLAEGARTNSALQSEVFKTSWTASNVTVTDNTAIAPNGLTTTDTLTAGAGNATLLQSVTSASANRALSVWLKRKTGTGNIDLTVDNGATWTTKTITGSWARYDISQTAVTNPVFGVRIVTSGDEIYIWGAQLEAGAFPSSYIPTTTASVTRNADVLSYPSNALGTMGSTYADIRTLWTAQNNKGARVLSIGTARPALFFDGTDGKLSLNDGTADRTGDVFTGSASSQKIASNWGGTASKTFISGVASSALGFDGDMNVGTMNVGCDSSSANQLGGTVKNLKIWKKALSDTKLKTLTK